MKKISLNDLKVESFVTSITKGKRETIKGGTGPETACCPSAHPNNCYSQGDEICVCEGFYSRTDITDCGQPGC